MVKVGFSALLLAFLRGVAEGRAFFCVVNLWSMDGRDVVPGGHIFRLYFFPLLTLFLAAGWAALPIIVMTEFCGEVGFG